jgi:tetratricopeptide (TPR) repeat protein
LPTAVEPRASTRCRLGAALIVVGILGSTAVATAEDACAVLVRKEQKASSRTVLLTGGNGWDLFRRYIDEAEKQQVGLSLWKSRVMVSDGKETKELSLGWTEMLTGQGAKERWSGLLKKVNAEPDDRALKEADRQQWDVVCYATAPTAREQGPGVGSQQPTKEVPLAAQQGLQQGIQYASRRDYDNAIKEFTQAIKTYPPYAAAYANRGVAYMQQKKFNLAMDDFKRASEIDPKDAFVHYNLTCWYSQQRQLDRALVSLDTALTNGFKDYEALRRDPELGNLRAHPEWRKTLEKHKIFIQ